MPRIRPFHVQIRDEALEDLRRRIAATRLPSKELVDDRSQGVQLATIKALARYWATDYDWRKVRGEAQRAAAVQDRDRRDGRPLHPRQVATRGRLAAGHHSRLAGLDHRDVRDRRPAHRPDRSRRTGGGRLPPGAAVPPRIRLLGRAIRTRLGRRSLRAGVGEADAPVSGTPATSPRAATSAPMSPTRWAARRQRG